MVDSESGSVRKEGRSITRLSGLTGGRIAKERTQVEVDPCSGKASGPNAAKFRSYLRVIARHHVSIIIPSWDDVEEADKNLTWQDIQLFALLQAKRVAAQERQSKNDAPHLLSRGGYELKKKKLMKARAEASRVESTDLLDPSPRYELWMYQTSVVMREPVIHDVDIVEAEDDPISRLLTILPRLKKKPIQLQWDIKVFGVDSSNCSLFISLSDALEIVGGNSMLNISIIQWWAIYMDKLGVEQAQAQVYGFIEPQSIQKSRNIKVQIQQYMQTWMS
uniref:Uncharacterized protein n=1 Tax=Cajanus cajan TaxID=3821 RepID=A0A151R3C4_CAJCA|nr:hypothetical protein KK1_041806 [Cajanus cajan]